MIVVITLGPLPFDLFVDVELDRLIVICVRRANVRATTLRSAPGLKRDSAQKPTLLPGDWKLKWSIAFHLYS